MPDTQATSTRRRIITEILDDVDVYVEGAGPEGPWYYRSLRVQRVMNTIRVYDVDGQLYEVYSLEDITDGGDSHKTLRAKLDAAHRNSLDEL